jgi:predicted small lipoprotein YifL
VKHFLTAPLVTLALLWLAGCGHFQRMDLPEQMTRVERKTDGAAAITNTTPVSDCAPMEEPRPSPPKQAELPPV